MIKRANKAGRPATGEIERRKARILRVATAEFFAKGFSGTSIAEIAGKAGVSTRTIYQHFGDKQDLFHATVKNCGDVNVFPMPQAREGTTLFEDLTDVAYYLLEVGLQRKTIKLVRLVISETHRFPEYAREVFDRTTRQLKANLHERFSELAAKYDRDGIDVEQTADLMMNLFPGWRSHAIYHEWGTTLPDRDEVEQKVGIVIRAMF